MKKIGLIIIAIILFATIYTAKAQTPTTENMQTFFDNEVAGIKVTVNATTETQPTENITINLAMKPLEEEVDVKYFNFSVFGFINGTDKTMIYNITENSFSLPYERNFTCPVPEQVWGVTHGEITLIYNIKYVRGEIEITIRDESSTIGFSMTYVENVYFENLSNIFEQLNQTFRQYYPDKDLTPENLNETLQKLQGSQNELGNTRMTVAVLAITTVFFIATTAYLAMRKPREYW